MRRLDTTTAAQQRSWRGVHRPAGSGAFSYPRIEASGRVARATEYLACRCGWRLVEIARTERSRRAAWRRLNEHIARFAREVAAGRAS